MTRRHPDTYPFWVGLIALAVIGFAVAQLRHGCGPDPTEARQPAPGVTRERAGPDWGRRPGDEEVEDEAAPGGVRWVEPGDR